MYSIEPQRLRKLRNGRLSDVGLNVYFIGLTSLLTDISSEMVQSILPIYVVFALQLTPLQFGFLDGLHQGASALARLGGGLLADRWRRNREVAAAGYGLSALCKLGLLAAGNVWGLLSAVIVLDRIGKGIRTAPRDALISLSCPPQHLGLAFGVHRAMDTVGALLGPLVAFAMLAALPHAYNVVFVTSFCIALVGVAALLLFVRNVALAGTATTTANKRPTLAQAFGLLQLKPFRGLVIAGALLGLVTVADAFFYLLLQRRTSMPISSFPLLYAATAVTYLLLAIPAGKLGDRIGRGRVFALGHVFLLGACLSLLVPGTGRAAGLMALALLGAYYACTDGVLMAAVSTCVPAELRASGMAILTTATGLTRLLASVMFGAAWSVWGMEFAFGLYATGLAVVLLLTLRTWIQLERTT